MRKVSIELILIISIVYFFIDLLYQIFIEHKKISIKKILFLIFDSAVLGMILAFG